MSIKLVRKKRERSQINKIRNEEGVQSTPQKYIRTISDCCEQLDDEKMSNLEEMDNSEKGQPPKMEPGRNRKHQ